jgi:hypothetical protein
VDRVGQHFGPLAGTREIGGGRPTQDLTVFAYGNLTDQSPGMYRRRAPGVIRQSAQVNGKLEAAICTTINACNQFQPRYWGDNCAAARRMVTMESV